MKFHHIGIATDDIQREISKVKALFNVIKISDTVYDKNQDAQLCMVTIEDGTNIELIQGKIVTQFVKRKHYLYHICFEVDNINDTITAFLENSGGVISDLTEAILFDNRKVVFLSCFLGIVELLEKK